MGVWKLGVGVNVDYHFTYDERLYSVPSALISAKVDVRATASMIEVWRDNRRVTSHERSYGPKGTAVTKPEHRPPSHRAWGDWPPERLIGWARTKGAKTGEVAEAILGRGPHPESGRRACLKLIRLGECYGEGRLEEACARALSIGNPTVKMVESILKHRLEKTAPSEEVEPSPVPHENIRGGEYFDRGEEVSERDEEEIEARYLEEERRAIIEEPSIDSSDGHDAGRTEEDAKSEHVNLAAPSAEVSDASSAAKSLVSLMGRAQMLLSNMPDARWVGRRSVGDRGGDENGDSHD